MFVPKSIVCFREGITRERLLADLMAGVVVGIVALPLALAFAIASGVPPERGLYTAIVAGFIISALGGSRVQIGGPTGAFVVIVYGIVFEFGYGGLVVATLLAGMFLIVMGLARFGSFLKFIPYPVVTGFTAGIAVLIFSSQVKDFLGLSLGAVPPSFAAKWIAYAEAIETINPAAAAIATGSLAVLIFWPRVSRRIPAPFVAMVLATLVVHWLDLPVETIGSRFGAMPSSLPRPAFPDIPWHQVSQLVSPALTIALLAAIESLLSAVVADGMTGGRHKSNMELVAQGIANIGSVLFGGIPATGAIARTATNVRSGGRTPIAGMTHAVVLVLILVFFGRLASMIPLAVLAAILMMVSYHMSEWRSFRSLLRAPRSDIAVLLVTFVLTVLVDLTVAVQVGIVLAALLFMKRMAEVTSIEGVTDELEDSLEEESSIDRRRARALASEGIEVYEVNGPFFFGAADKLRDVLGEVAKRPYAIVLRMRHVPAIDATGLHALLQFAKKCRHDGIELFISEVRRQPRRAIVRSELLDLIGRHNFADDLDKAVEKARVRRPTAD
jgi:sulfate permease, SulP family